MTQPALIDKINLTDSAVSALRKLNATEEFRGMNLRLGVEGSSCCGYSYRMYFDDQVAQDDRVFEFEELKVVVDPVSMQFLAGTTIDYLDQIANGGFRFLNPNAKSSCGCGSSFSV